MKPLEPILIKDLFYQLDYKLIELLKSLSKEDWEKQTIAPLWKVKDVAAHLLDGNIRGISVLRDHYFGEPAQINSYQALVDYLNMRNADWIKAMKNVSPVFLIELLESTGKQYCEILQALDPFDKAVFSVAWAGEQESLNWFHIAREYTEKWHHQQQIRFAIGKDNELYSREFYYPHLDTSMRALSHHYRDVKANNNDVIKFTVTGVGGGSWFLNYNIKKWLLIADCNIAPICEVELDGEIAWRIFTKGISKQEAENRTKITGDKILGYKIFDMLAVMA